MRDRACTDGQTECIKIFEICWKVLTKKGENIRIDTYQINLWSFSIHYMSFVGASNTEKKVV